MVFNFINTQVMETSQADTQHNIKVFNTDAVTH